MISAADYVHYRELGVLEVLDMYKLCFIFADLLPSQVSCFIRKQALLPEP